MSMVTGSAQTTAKVIYHHAPVPPDTTLYALEPSSNTWISGYVVLPPGVRYEPLTGQAERPPSRADIRRTVSAASQPRQAQPAFLHMSGVQGRA